MEDKSNPPAPAGTPSSIPPAFETLIPEEFRDRAYLSDLKTLPVGPDAYKALFKKLEGAQVLIGKKAGAQPPAADAPAEEAEKFYSTLRPAKAEEYEFPKPAEGQTVDEEFVKNAREIFYQAGLSKAQVAKMLPAFEKYAIERNAPAVAEAQKLDKEFAEMTTKTFGAETAPVLARSKALLETLTPDTLKPYLNRLPNEALVVLTGVMESVRAKFMKEDSMDGGNPTGAATDVATLNEDLQKVYASDAWKDYKHKDHESVQLKARSIAEAISKAKEAGGKR